MNSLLDSIEKILLVIIIFLSGFVASGIVQNSGIELPAGILQYGSNNVPSDRLTEDNIEIYDNKVVINVEGASISEYADTNSMLPIIDEGANGIRIQPKSEDEIKVGDIISFEQDGMLIVHRVVEIGEDSEGKYFVTKGDNNAFSDGKIRFEQIRYVTIGVLY